MTVPAVAPKIGSGNVRYDASGTSVSDADTVSATVTLSEEVFRRVAVEEGASVCEANVWGCETVWASEVDVDLRTLRVAPVATDEHERLTVAEGDGEAVGMICISIVKASPVEPKLYPLPTAKSTKPQRLGRACDKK